jgi:cell division inhibitor SepF
MSIFDNLKKLTQPYGDDEYEDEYEDEVDGYDEEPISRRSDFGTAPAADNKSGKFTGPVMNINSKSSKQEVVLFRPTTFSDSTKAADDLRDKKAVIANMENVDKALARRVVDFLTGCDYAFDGKVNTIAHCTCLFCPYSMDVVDDLEAAQAETESYIC